MAPRWTYIDPAIAFNPVISFTVLIMALLGGVHRLYGPVLGVVPLALLFEYPAGQLPQPFQHHGGPGLHRDRLRSSRAASPAWSRARVRKPA